MPRRAFLVLMALALLVLSPDVAAQEAGESASLSPQETAHFRVAHFSPDTPAIDVRFDGQPSGLKTLDYTHVSNWLAVPAGQHEIALVLADGGEAAVTLPDRNLEPRVWITLALVGSSGAGSLEVVQVREVIDALLPGTTRVIYFNAIENAGSVGFFRNGNLYTSLAFGQSFPIEHDAQVYDYHITGGEGPQQLAELPQLDLRENYNYLIAAVGSAGATGDAAPRLVVVETNPVEFKLGLGQIEEPGMLVQAVRAHGLVGELEQALERAGLLETLSGAGPYTLFAPAELRLSNLPEDPEALAAILEAHLVEGLYQSQDLAQGVVLQALNGQTLTATVEDNAIYVNGARLLDVNIPARNGVMHLISGFATNGAVNLTP